VAYNPQGHIRTYSESAHESIQEVEQQEKDGYCSDEEEVITQPDPRKRTVFMKIMKNFEVSTASHYLKCSKFSQKRFNSKWQLNTLRLGLLIPNLVVLLTSLATTEVMWFFYYFTYWGFFANIVSLVTSIKAVTQPEYYQQAAVVSTDVSLSMNIVLTFLFWYFMAPLVFPDLSWSGVDLFLRFQMVTLHSLPLLSTAVNVFLTDITFFKKDWKIIMAVGSSYSAANCIGSLALGHQLYPVVDWKIPTVSIAVFCFIAVLMSGVHLAAAHITQKHKAYRRKQGSKDRVPKLKGKHTIQFNTSISSQNESIMTDV